MLTLASHALTSATQRRDVTEVFLSCSQTENSLKECDKLLLNIMAPIFFPSLQWKVKFRLKNQTELTATVQHKRILKHLQLVKLFICDGKMELEFMSRCQFQQKTLTGYNQTVPALSIRTFPLTSVPRSFSLATPTLFRPLSSPVPPLPVTI